MISNPKKKKSESEWDIFFHFQNWPELLNNNHCHQRWIKMIKVVTSIDPGILFLRICTKEIIWVMEVAVEPEAAQIGILGQETIESRR